jgi:site-specific DNA-methyltransferase (adenine-specific)
MDNEVKVVISHGEIAWTNCFRGIRLFRHLWSGAYRASEPGYHVHPSQKPVALMRWCLDMFTVPGDLVFDPFMGSGPVARACYEMGRKYVGIEINEQYCQKAVDRLSLKTLFEV